MQLNHIISQFKSAKKKLLLLDYDGTLVDFTPTPQEAKPSLRLLNLLSGLTAQKGIKLVLITGRSRESIEMLLGTMPARIIAEHGAVIRKKNSWKSYTEERAEWKPEIIKLMNRFVKVCKGSFIEEKEFAVCWHYRQSAESDGETYSRKLIDELAWHLKEFNLRLIDGKKVVEVLPAIINKGKAVSNLVSKKTFDSILCIGDDKNDEEMFNVLRTAEHYHTIKVGKGETAAKNRLNSVEDVLTLLEKL